MKRRLFLTKSGAAAGLLMTIPVPEMNPLPKGLRVVFQGDSITDASRERGDYYANNGRGLGTGYVLQIAGHLLGTYPEAGISVFNRGISGHKVFQLLERWEIDCIALKPDVLSLLIGVNDYWHGLNGTYEGTVDTYKQDLGRLLEWTKKEVPDCKLIIGEPFAVPGGTAINERWKNFDAYRKVALDMAHHFEAAFIPYHQIFLDALKVAPAKYWCPDGVHPSVAGANLMKNAWLKAFDGVMK